MIVTSPSTTARLKVISLLTAEFTPDGFLVYGDRLHKSLGRNKTVIGVSPINEVPWSANKLVLNCTMLVQFYGRWKADVDPELRVDPSAVETYAERFRRVIHGNDPDLDSVWYFNLTEVTYPTDPTGNITRFEAKVEAIGNNSALLLETG